MHKVAVITLAAGAVILLLGVILLVIAGPSAGNVYIDPEEKAEWRAGGADETQLPFLHSEEESRDYEIYARRGAAVENLTVVDEAGTDLLWVQVYCSEANHQQDDSCQNEWVVIAEFVSDACPCFISFNTTGEVLVVEYGEAGSQSLVDEWTGQFCGGAMALCLGIILLGAGGGVATFIKADHPVTEYQPPAQPPS